MIDAITIEAGRRGITRLCHFTPSRNFVHIVSDSYAVRPTRDLLDDARADFTSTDLKRLDGYRNHVCCSIQYPNAWYLETARAKAEFRSFPDWVVLVISPHYLWHDGTKFCPANAAGAASGDIQEGAAAFTNLFAPSLPDRQGRTWIRAFRHLSSCPTNLQAEVLVPATIPLEHVTHVIVRDEEQARLETSRLSFVSGVRPQPIVICPTLFNKDALKNALRGGVPPVEVPWSPA